MVVARASGTDLASILSQNTFLTLGVHPARGPGSARDGGTEGGPGRGDTGGPGTGGRGARGGPGKNMPTRPHAPSTSRQHGMQIKRRQLVCHRVGWACVDPAMWAT